MLTMIMIIKQQITKIPTEEKDLMENVEQLKTALICLVQDLDGALKSPM